MTQSIDNDKKDCMKVIQLILVSFKLLYFIQIYHFVKLFNLFNFCFKDKQITKRQYKKSIFRSCSSLNLNSNKYLPLGKDTTGVIVQIEKDQKVEISTLGNLINDIFQEHYSCNLPVSAMRYMPEFDKRCVYVVIGKVE